MKEQGRTWKEILDSQPAQVLRHSAQRTYSSRRIRTDAPADSNKPDEIIWLLVSV